jgi:hypothetical protein
MGGGLVVAESSCVTPAVLFACKEANVEAQSVYKLTRFEDRTSWRKIPKSGALFYNPSADVVFFG